MAQKILAIMGALLVFLGIVGFIPGVTSEAKLLGLFSAAENTLSAIHLVAGIIALLFSRFDTTKAAMLAKILGLFFAVIAVIGLIQGEAVLGLFAVNLADNLFHVALAILFLVAGLGKLTPNPDLATAA